MRCGITGRAELSGCCGFIDQNHILPIQSILLILSFLEASLRAGAYSDQEIRQDCRMDRMDRVSESNETALMRPLQIRSSVQPAYSSDIGRSTLSFKIRSAGRSLDSGTIRPPRDGCVNRALSLFASWLEPLW